MFEDYKHCLEATQFENKINQPEKDEVDNLRKNHKTIIKLINIKITAKIQRRETMCLLKKLTDCIEC